ncbi:MAG: class I SAM-dependent methyltransferase [Tumebacillaceae bacterium]
MPTCPVCQSDKTAVFLQRHRLPVHQHTLLSTENAAQTVQRGELELAMCQKCQFVFNQSFDLSLLAYEKDYDNTQSHSAFFQDYMDQLVHNMVHRSGVKNAHIVEVGCGKGVFLKQLAAADPGNRGVGFDPSYMGPLEEPGSRVRFERRFYDESCTAVPADVVVCRHVIEHVPEPLELLMSIRKALVNADKPKLFFETPCVEWILENQVIYDFFYEHCSYFTAHSLSTLFERAGFKVERVEHVFQGQYLWLEATLAEEATEPRTTESNRLWELAEAFSAGEKQIAKSWEASLRELKQAGKKTAVWGAGAKGVTFLNLLSDSRDLVDCVVDVNPKKQGNYLPGTGHLIVSPSDLSSRGIDTAILMNPNYRMEIEQMLNQLGLRIDLLSE